MAIYNSDLAVKGTVLRVSKQEDEGVVTGQIVFPVGSIIVATDTVNVAKLGANHYLTYARFRMGGGASSGYQGTLGYASDGSLLSPDPDVDAYIAALDDGAAGVVVEASLTGTSGTIFPGNGPTGGKAMYDNDTVDVVWTMDNASASTALAAGNNVVTFLLKYKRIHLLGGNNDGKYLPAPIVLPTDPEEIIFDYNGGPSL